LGRRNELSLLVRALDFVVTIYTFLIIVRAIISWVNPDPYNPIVRTLDRLTGPVLNPIRKVMMRISGNLPIDFSPIIAIFLIQLLGRLLRSILMQ
jgi:YggT family protein